MSLIKKCICGDCGFISDEVEGLPGDDITPGTL